MTLERSTLGMATSELWEAVNRAELSDPDWVVRQVRKRNGRRLVLGAVTVLALAGAALVRLTGDVEHPAASVPTSTQSAEDLLLEDVRQLSGRVGWTIVSSQLSSSTDAIGPGRYVEGRFSEEDGGRLLISIRTGDTRAASSAAAGRGDPLATDGTATVYLGTRSDQATAVELVDLDRIIYVRSEGVEPRSVEQLTPVALDLNQMWQLRGSALYDPAPTPSAVLQPNP